MTKARTKAKATKPVARAKVTAPKKLSELKVINLKPKADRYEIADGQPGLRLRVFPSGAKSWCYLYRSPIDRTWTRLTLGQYPALSVKAARRQASKAAAQVAEETDPAAEKKSRRRALDIARRHTVENVVTEFQNAVTTHFRPKWRREVERVLETEIVPRWKRRLITNITEQDVADIQAAIRERGSPAMADRVVGVAKMLFRFAAKAPRRYVSVNPASEIGLAKIKSRQHTLSDPEIKLLWNACEGLGQYGQILKLLLLTGARLTEIGHLQWSEINFPERMLILPPGRTKTDTPHLMPLSEPAMAILKSVKQNDNEFVFPTVTGLKIANWSFHKRRLDSTLGKAMRPWRVHDLRRTCRTGLSRLRIAPHVAEACLGHAAPAIVRTYDVHDLADEKRHALEAWAGLVQRTVSPVDNIVAIRG